MWERAGSQWEEESTEGYGQRCGQPQAPRLAWLMSQSGSSDAHKDLRRNGCSGALLHLLTVSPHGALGSYPHVRNGVVCLHLLPLKCLLEALCALQDEQRALCSQSHGEHCWEDKMRTTGLPESLENREP